MLAVNMLQAKSSLSRLVKAVELGEEKEIMIARNGRLVAKLVAVTVPNINNRIGIAKGEFTIPDHIDQDNDEIAKLFLGNLT